MGVRFDDRGREIPDPTPIEIPEGHKKPESLKDIIARMVQQHGLHRVASEGDEDFDEANDFEMDEDDSAEMFPTHHELHEEVIDEARKVRDERAASSRKEKSEGVQGEADEPADGGRVPRSEEDSEDRSVKTGPRSPQRRRPRRREDAERDEGDSQD